MTVIRPMDRVVEVNGHQIPLILLIQWKHALRLEIKGMRFSHGSVSAHVRGMLGMSRRGRKSTVLAEVERLVEEGGSE